jgi:hypothetical protein
VQVNLAPFGDASLVNQYPGNFNAEYGNDSNLGTMFQTQLGTSSDPGVWTLELPAAGQIRRVETVNRGAVDDRINGAVLEVLADDGATVIGAPVVLADDGNPNNGETQSFTNGGAGYQDAAYVRLTHESNYLHLREVRAVVDSITTGKPTSGDVHNASYPTSHGNDGNLSTFTHGTSSSANSWQVDLEGLYRVDFATLLGRISLADRTNGATLKMLGPDRATVLAQGTVSGLSDSGPGYGAYTLDFGKPGLFGVSAIEVDGGQYLHVGELVATGTPAVIEDVALQQPTAEVSQDDLPIGEVLDGAGGAWNGWGNGPAFGENSAVVETVEDIAAPGMFLKFQMDFNSFGDHGIGRFRLSATTADRNEFADGLANGGDVGFDDPGDTGQWVVLDDLVGFETASGLQLAGGALQADGSLLIDDTTSPGSDVYTIWMRSPLADITGFRLELLEDPSLPHNGPGLKDVNGNSVLTEFGVSLAYVPEPASAALAVWAMVLLGLLPRRGRRPS